MAFWTDKTAPEPKRQFRFKVLFTNMEDGGVWYARSATKPTFTVNTSEHKFLNHTFYYPGSVTWNTVTLSFVDPTKPDATGDLLKLLAESGYRVPGGPVVHRQPAGATGGDTADFQTIGKANSHAALGDVKIQGLDASGKIIEEWTLNGSFITGITLNDYDYGSEDLSTVDVEIRYDWASYGVPEGNHAYGPTSLFAVEGEGDKYHNEVIELATPEGAT